MTSIHICTASDMHPFACHPDDDEAVSCIHCLGTKSETHDPESCALCHYFDEEPEDQP